MSLFFVVGAMAQIVGIKNVPQTRYDLSLGLETGYYLLKQVNDASQAAGGHGTGWIKAASELVDQTITSYATNSPSNETYVWYVEVVDAANNKITIATANKVSAWQAPWQREKKTVAYANRATLKYHTGTVNLSGNATPKDGSAFISNEDVTAFVHFTGNNLGSWNDTNQASMYMVEFYKFDEGDLDISLPAVEQPAYLDGKKFRLLSNADRNNCLQIMNYNKAMGNGQASEGALQYKAVAENEEAQLFSLEVVNAEENQYYLKNEKDGVTYYLYANQWNYFASVTKKTVLTIEDPDLDGAFTIYQNSANAGHLGNDNNKGDGAYVYSDNGNGNTWYFAILPGYYTISAGEKYVSDDRKSDSETQRVLTTETSEKNIFYYDGKGLVGYATGYGFEYACCNTKTPDAMNHFEFRLNLSGNGYVVKASEGTSTKGWADGFWKANDGDYLERVSATDASIWTLEEVVELPVAVSEAGYATLYTPVALDVPAGIKAYTVKVDGPVARMTEVAEIPANTGVILAGEEGVPAVEGTYNFAVIDAAAAATSDLTGSVIVTKVSDDAYVLGNYGGEVGFYTANKDQDDGTAFISYGHKAYLPKSVGSGVSFYGFHFGDEEDGTTAIEAVVENAETVIFDLAGRKVSEITAPGIYIVNGKKVIK